MNPQMQANKGLFGHGIDVNHEGAGALRRGDGTDGTGPDSVGEFRLLYGLEESRRSGIEPFQKSQTLGHGLDSAKPIAMNLDTEADEEQVNSNRERDRFRIQAFRQEHARTVQSKISDHNQIVANKPSKRKGTERSNSQTSHQSSSKDAMKFKKTKRNI